MAIRKQRVIVVVNSGVVPAVKEVFDDADFVVADGILHISRAAPPVPEDEIDPKRFFHLGDFMKWDYVRVTEYYED